MIIRIRKKILFAVLGCSLLALAVFAYLGHTTEADAPMPVTGRTILIDAGHGGIDGGAVSPGGVSEKDINLNIAKYLKNYLEQGGAQVLMTREEDISLHGDDQASIRNKKRSDLLKRKDIANTSATDLFLSVHLNQFEQSKYKGAQVFYETKNTQSQDAAVTIQKALKEYLDSTNERQAMKIGNDKILFQDLKVPAVIVECGFLSNPEEEALLKTEEYQQKAAFAIYMGIQSYFNQ